MRLYPRKRSKSNIQRPRRWSTSWMTSKMLTAKPAMTLKAPPLLTSGVLFSTDALSKTMLPLMSLTLVDMKYCVSILRDVRAPLKLPSNTEYKFMITLTSWCLIPEACDVFDYGWKRVCVCVWGGGGGTLPSGKDSQIKENNYSLENNR